MTDPRLTSLKVTVVSSNVRILAGDLNRSDNSDRPTFPIVIDGTHEHVRLSQRIHTSCTGAM